ncbi:hypothetical protein RUM44_012951 [Polyplax serrata]|uniref:Major facilitator superfamily (MFS) profile domain-containing protein n=1 Tax=Polyplax serrata TaxID=468196 RepID=A0ABR1BD28_POLSC
MGCSTKISEKIPARHIICFMLFLGFMVSFLLRVNINLTIVAMVNSTNSKIDCYNSTIGNDCAGNTSLPDVNDTQGKLVDVKSDNLGEFEWNELQQGVILSSFFWGYIFFQIPGGRIAELWGPKVVFGTSVLLNGLLSLILPFIARMHWILLLIVRALQGLGQGVIFPCLTASVPRWVPVEERARFISFAIQGCSLGQVVALPLCGWIITTLGWPSVFYISGTLGLLWYFAWYFLVYDSPDEHPWISSKEKQYLDKHIEKIDPTNAAAIPWLTILTSAQFWVGAIAGFGSDWGFHTFCTFGPKYIKTSLGFDLQQSSWLSSLPFLSQYIFSFGFSNFCDWLLRVGVSIVVVRKFSVIVSHIMPAAGLLVLSLTSNVTFSVVILTFCVTMLGALSSGFFQNPLDIAPNYAGSLTGITNTLGAMTAVISTPLAGILLQSNETRKAWHYIFYISMSVYVLSSLPYLVFAKIKLEPWNDLHEKEKRTNSSQNLAKDPAELEALTSS